MDKLTIHELSVHLLFGVRFQLPLSSERNEYLIEDEPWKFVHSLDTAIDANIKSAIDIKNNEYFQEDYFLTIEDGDFFLGSLKSTKGWELDDVFADEVKPLLHPITEEFIFACIEDNDDALHVLVSAHHNGNYEHLRHDLFMSLVKAHGDVYSLIPRGLAVEIK